MAEGIVLATILHDVEGRLCAPLVRAAPALQRFFSGIAVSLTEATAPEVARVLEGELGALVARSARRSSARHAGMRLG